MNNGIQITIYPVSDIAKAKAQFQELLGVAPYADTPYYVGFKVGNQDIGLDPNGHKAGVTSYYQVTDIQNDLQKLLDAGAEIVEPLKDVGGGRQVTSVKDSNGNLVGLFQDPVK